MDTAIFNHIYKSKHWGDEGNGSGPGSSVQEAFGISHILYHLILSLQIVSVLDAACGGMVWQRQLIPHVQTIIPNFRYIGVDASSVIIQKNR